MFAKTLIKIINNYTFSIHFQESLIYFHTVDILQESEVSSDLELLDGWKHELINQQLGLFGEAWI